MSDRLYSEAKDDKTKKEYERVVEDYLVLKMAAHTELTIMELNRVGVEKNMKSIIEQTAKHVGLAMPKGWKETVKDPFDNRNK